jgi:transcriptional regulator with XRE-family HTH domain
MEARDFISDLLAKGLTQAVIAERTGIPQPTISKVVTGRVSDVLSTNYRKLEALHTEVCSKAAAEPATESTGSSNA